MDKLKFEFDQAVFTYAISTKAIDFFSQKILLKSNSLIVNYTSMTDVKQHNNNDTEIVIIGLCIDSYGKLERDEIPSYILNNTTDIDSVYHLCNRFAGKYIVLYIDSNGVIYIFGDATNSLPINYAFDKSDYCISSVDGIVAEYYGFNVSDYSIKIRKGSALTQPMPNDLTMYDEVKALLPNHYLNIYEGSTVRVKLQVPDITQNAVIESTIKIVSNIVKEYAKYYDIVCPLTSGWDSRLVLSFLKNEIDDLKCYTFAHPDGNAEQDIEIAQRICNDLGLEHYLLDDTNAPKEYMELIQKYIGLYYSDFTINLAYTYNCFFYGKALINGDIIDQVGKSLLGNAVPTAFARTSYFVCKLHNKEKLVKKEIKEYIKKIKKFEDKNYIYDLFALESRCGRWASQSSMLYSLCAVNSLNIFNCGELIMQWISIPRKYRVDRFIHKNILSILSPELLNFPFNPDDKYAWLGKNWITFYIATYLKQFLK